MNDSSMMMCNKISKIMTEVWWERFRGALHFEPDPEKILRLTLDYIDKAREVLKLRKYEPGKFGAERVLMDMAARRDLERVANPHIGIY